MTQNAQKTDVAPAMAGPIDDGILKELIELSKTLNDGNLTHEGGTLLLLCVKPLFEELLERRQASHLIKAIEIGNVHFLTPPLTT